MRPGVVCGKVQPLLEQVAGGQLAVQGLMPAIVPVGTIVHVAILLVQILGWIGAIYPSGSAAAIAREGRTEAHIVDVADGVTMDPAGARVFECSHGAPGNLAFHGEIPDVRVGGLDLGIHRAQRGTAEGIAAGLTRCPEVIG